MGSSEKPSAHLVLGKLHGGLQHISAEYLSDQWGVDQLSFSEMARKSDTQWMGFEKTQIQTAQYRIRRLHLAFDQVQKALGEIGQVGLNEDQAKRVFSTVLDRILLSEAFLESLRFLESQRLVEPDEIWESWDESLQRLAAQLEKNFKAISKKNAAVSTTEGKALEWTLEVLSSMGDTSHFYSMRFMRLMMLQKIMNEKIYDDWLERRQKQKANAQALQKMWGGLDDYVKPLSVLEVQSNAGSSLGPDIQESSATSNKKGFSPLLDDHLEGAIDEAAGREVGTSPKRDSGIRKPGQGRTEEQKLKLGTAADRARAATERANQRLKEIRDKASPKKDSPKK